MSTAEIVRKFFKSAKLFYEFNQKEVKNMSYEGYFKQVLHEFVSTLTKINANLDTMNANLVIMNTNIQSIVLIQQGVGDSIESLSTKMDTIVEAAEVIRDEVLTVRIQKPTEKKEQ